MINFYLCFSYPHSPSSTRQSCLITAVSWADFRPIGRCLLGLFSSVTGIFISLSGGFIAVPSHSRALQHILTLRVLGNYKRLSVLVKDQHLLSVIYLHTKQSLSNESRCQKLHTPNTHFPNSQMVRIGLLLELSGFLLFIIICLCGHNSMHM